MVKFVFTVVKKLLGEGKLTLKSVDKVVAADRELEKISAHQSTARISLENLASASRKVVNIVEWQSIIETYTPRSVHWYEIRTPEVDILGKVFSIMFDRLEPAEAVLYSVSHALLPTQMVEALQRNRDSNICLKLLKDTFAPVWSDLEQYLMGFFDDSQEAESIAASVTHVLKKRLTLKSSFADFDRPSAIIAKLDKLSLDVPSTRDFVNIGQRMPKLGNLSDQSLYENIILRQKAAGQSETAEENETSGGRGRARLARGTVTLPNDSFKPSSYCHGHLNLLNYATLGVDIAEALLRHIGATVPKVARTGSIFKPLPGNLIACLEKEVRNLSSSRQGSSTSLEQIALSMAAFQVALEASKVQALPHLENAWDEPAWRQTFFAKYCQTLCGRSATGSGSAWVDAALACNLVVMHSPEFTRLFRCQTGEPMVPSQYCSAL
ncbi:hypothetical protein HPB48_008064 [Haemaphysalis longicornis]|uniref:Peptidase M13 C-terminal domain-containing protein n=1 Tax=Haemaphysalis longicornis TaxID=44386 RepID=A0A9J6FUI4_HAELO|nr:hypothetical protein HPB48_008064 [Haemaphysalis longicornis]